MGILADLSGDVIWKAGAVVGGIAAISLGVALTVKSFEMANVEKQSKALQIQIEDPKTGYVARLAQSETNVSTLTTQVTNTNATLKAQSAQSQAIIASLTLKVTAANQAAAASKAKVDEAMKLPLSGATVCDRYDDADNRLLGLLQ